MKFALTPELTWSMPAPVSFVMALAETGGNWVRIDDGTVNVPAPAVVLQRKAHVSEVWLRPVPLKALEQP